MKTIIDEDYEIPSEYSQYDPRKNVGHQIDLLSFYCGLGIIENAKYLIRKYNKEFKLSMTLRENHNDECGLYAAILNQKWSLIKEMRADDEISSQVKITKNHKN